MHRRTLLAAVGATFAAAAAQPLMAAPVKRKFPKGFLWGAATAGHQIEGNNVNSDIWVMENVKPTIFSERSGDAVNSFELWPKDLDLVQGLGLNTYRFSIEWARIEPEQGHYSIAMLDHYKAMIDGCLARGLTAVVTFSHWANPRWFAARGGWTMPDAPDLFARYCERAARHLASRMGYALTLNEPNPLGEPPPAAIVERVHAMDAAAGRAVGSENFHGIFVTGEDRAAAQKHLLEAHQRARAAIKSVRPDLPVGFSMALPDDQEEGPGSVRDARRVAFYGAWMDLAKADDFLGVQNYTRTRWDSKGPLPPPAGAKVSGTGDEVYPASLANAVRYAHKTAGVPIFVTEHGIGADDDTLRADLIPAALAELHTAIGEGIPVIGYLHWSLLDNYEWVSGYKRHYGLVAVDRTTFKRTPKPSAGVLSAIARRNAL